MEPQLKLKFFSVEEANKAVPVLAEHFCRLFQLNMQLKIISADLRELANIWGSEVFSRRNPDFGYYKDLVAKRDAATDEVSRIANAIGSLGCIIKDFNNGIVDFCHKSDDKVVLLCWHYGEDKIRFWHDTRVGFGSRRALAELAEN